ncbi:uncharacterized protein CIMIP4 isoform X1 [Dromaius novaehollandiae]|uniref:uncharacterized protein CIMIP4 isoform X1 n=1 Tax=Dromaius novaehollandiae TaxID=8790 RepID=UPI00311D9057
MAPQLLPRALVTAKWLLGAIRAQRVGPSLRVLDTSWYPPQERNARQEFRESHIPGALFFDIEECRDKSSPYDFMLPSEAHFANYVGHLGISNDTHVVVYDGDKLGTFYAPRAWWMFRAFGHREVSVLNGGFKNWVKEGHPVTAEVSQPAPAVFKATLDKALLKTFEEMVENLGSRRFQVVDSRPEGRFRGNELDQEVDVQQSSLILWPCCASALQEVPQALAPPTPDLAKSDSVLAGSSSVEPGEGRKEHLPAGSRPSSQRTSLRSSSRTSWKISKGSSAQGMAKNSTSVKSQASPSAKCVQNKSHSKQSLQAKTPSMQDLHSRRLEEEGGDTSATKHPSVGHELRGRNSNFRFSALSRQKEAEDKPSSNAKEPAAGQHRTLGSRVPGSPQKTTKASYKEAKDTRCRLSAKESLASLGRDVKAEGKLLLEKRNTLIHANSKYKSVSADELTSSEEERQALCKAGLIVGQKRLSDRTEMLQNPLTSASFADYYKLGFYLRSNIFQGGPLESRSLMKDSYTPDVIEKAIRDPKNWHGRRTDELGRWHQKNALNLNLQKAFEEKYGKNKGKP